MVIVLLSMAAGMVLGLRFIPEKYQKLNSKLQYILIAILIFCMGASLGSDPMFFQNLSTVGLKAVLFAIIPALCSILCVYVATKKLLKKGAGNDDSSGGR